MWPLEVLAVVASVDENPSKGGKEDLIDPSVIQPSHRSVTYFSFTQAEYSFVVLARAQPLRFGLVASMETGR